MKNFYVMNDGFTIPKIGFGTYKLKGYLGQRQLEQAINVGYRLLDSAFNYENEGTVGRAVKASGVPRDQITVTSKLPGRHHEYHDAVETIQESVLRTGLDYIDLYLIHWPNPIEDKYVQAWQALIDMQKAGLIRSIGVSNFLPEHIDRLEKETGVLPVVNQIELHPYFNQEAQRAYHKEKGIITEGWSPIGRAGAVMEDPVIKEIAEKHDRSEGEVILRWHTHLGVVPIPKSANYQRQYDNLHVFDFELDKEDIEKINQLTRPDGRNKGQDPAVYQEF